MLKGKTSSGFSFVVEDFRLNNMELLEVLNDIDEGKTHRVPKAVLLLLGEEQKHDFYEHLRNGDGIVPVDVAAKELMEIIESGADGKN